MDHCEAHSVSYNRCLKFTHLPQSLIKPSSHTIAPFIETSNGVKWNDWNSYEGFDDVRYFKTRDTHTHAEFITKSLKKNTYFSLSILNCIE